MAGTNPVVPRQEFKPITNLLTLHAHRSMLQHNQNDHWHAYRLIDRGVLLDELPPNDRHQEEVVVTWFLKHKPQDFRFDPIARRFAPATTKN